jgi:hypothetical protein
MVPDHRKLSNAVAWKAAVYTTTITPAMAVMTSVAQTGVPQRELLPRPRGPAVSLDSA